MELQFFLLRNTSDGKEDASSAEPIGEFLAHGKFAEKAILDQRINAIAAILVSSQNDGEKTHLVVTGDSSGKYSLYHVNEASQETPFGYPFYRSERPILSLATVPHEAAMLIFVGTADGLVSIIHLDDTELVRTSTSPLIEPVLCYQGHSMGTNSVAARLLKTEDKPTMCVCSVGDDQAICCCHLSLNLEADSEMAVLRKCLRPEASLSESLHEIARASPFEMPRKCRHRTTVWRAVFRSRYVGSQNHALDPVLTFLDQTE